MKRWETHWQRGHSAFGREGGCMPGIAAKGVPCNGQNKSPVSAPKDAIPDRIAFTAG